MEPCAALDQDDTAPRFGTGQLFLPLAGCHKLPMTQPVPHPYAIEVAALAKPEGQFGWAIRKHGKLIERFDRAYTSEAKAHEKALEAIERDMNPAAQQGRK